MSLRKTRSSLSLGEDEEKIYKECQKLGEGDNSWSMSKQERI